MYPKESDAKELVAELCKLFYDQGWVSGTGGGISIRCSAAQGDSTRLVMAPSGVQKERMRSADMFVLDMKGGIVHTPEEQPPPYKPPKLSECSPLFMLAYDLRGAGAVMHSHSINAMMATLLDPTASEFRCTHLEMMKGISGHGFYDLLTVPIIENTARECELTDRMHAAMLKYPKSNAVLVRRHGVYVWGKTWIEAKTQAECYDYLFQAAAQMMQNGVDAGRPPAALPLNGKSDHSAMPTAAISTDRPCKRLRTASQLPSCVVLDIEGTLVPITFVSEILFPYAKAHARSFLETTYDCPETQEAINMLTEQATQDVGAAIPGAQLIPAEDRATQISACIANIEAQMAADRKTTALKHLQGLIWTGGYRSGEIQGQLFSDVPDALQQMRNHGIKTYIYSSGSRRAQRDLFGHTQVGDVRPYLMGFFDTTSGPKRKASSYVNIAQSLAVDGPEDIVFATDILEEAAAAKQAGWRCVLVKRDGNAALPDAPGFPVVDSMDKFLQSC
eukprot:jgi/Ulvmu1/3358/UM156_0015.1